MPSEVRVSSFAAKVQANAFARLLDGGYIEVRSGSRPASVDQPATGDALARFWFQTPSAPPTLDGTLEFNSFAEAVATGDGDPGYFRACTDAGQPVFDGPIGDDGVLTLSGGRIRKGGRVAIRSARYKVA